MQDGSEDCLVARGILVQEYRCEECNTVEGAEQEVRLAQKHLEETKELRDLMGRSKEAEKAWLNEVSGLLLREEEVAVLAVQFVESIQNHGYINVAPKNPLYEEVQKLNTLFCENFIPADNETLTNPWAEKTAELLLENIQRLGWYRVG